MSKVSRHQNTAYADKTSPPAENYIGVSEPYILPRNKITRMSTFIAERNNIVAHSNHARNVLPEL